MHEKTCSGVEDDLQTLQEHKQHLLTKDWPLLTRLSIVSILSLAIVHKKKDTHLGTFAHQIHSQGKTSMRGLDNYL